MILHRAPKGNVSQSSVHFFLSLLTHCTAGVFLLRSTTAACAGQRAAALGRLGQNQGGGIHTPRVVGASDEVVGSSGAVHH